MNDCVFCKIIEGDIPSSKVYEDEKIYAFLDISQVTKGHTLIVPKEHVKDIYEYDEILAADVFSRIPMVARALKKAFPDMKGLNIVNNNEPLAYQSVFHSHFHLIPRYQEDEGFAMKFENNQTNYNQDDLLEIADTINKNIQ
ncbi:HIT family protein [Fundicoccus culcitae]|uniref:HIT family protein n=1 Tax=Fundicoccus culcitae TaxID=2969821 RepID=A0ABY5P5W3_9LACT|nr:HIT family protein [Fundicoccus culcitae]UUX33944.1 HIT family protein [Fundicoccus culcitae]